MSTLRFVVFALLALVLLAGCGGATSSGTAHKPSPTASPEGSSASANPEADTASIGGGGFPCSDRHSGGSPNLPAQLTDIRVAQHDGFDRITFQFAPPTAPSAFGGPRTGVPTYSLEPRPAASFAKDPSGFPIKLDGAAGLHIVFRDTSAVDGSVASKPQTYTGSTDLRPLLPFVREVAQLGDVERVMSWGVGLSSAGCLRVTELANPSRLAVDVRSMPRATTAQLPIRRPSRPRGAQATSPALPRPSPSSSAPSARPPPGNPWPARWWQPTCWSSPASRAISPGAAQRARRRIAPATTPWRFSARAPTTSPWSIPATGASVATSP